MVAVVCWGFWEQVGSFLLDVAAPYEAIWGTPAITLVLLGILRYSTLQGFVSYSEADCLFLLSAPVARGELIWPRLRRLAVVFGVCGAVIAALATTASSGWKVEAATLLQEIAAGTALGIALFAGVWHVERLANLSLWVRRMTIPALGFVVLLALGERAGGTGALAALCSGPWGWVLLPNSPHHWAWGVAGVVLLCSLAVAGWVSLQRSAGRVSAESFIARARTRSQVVAGLYALDTRSVALATRAPWSEQWRGRVRLPVPRRPVLAVPWHSLLSLLRSPMRLGCAVILGGGGLLLLALEPGRTSTSWAGALALYLAASALAEPIRLEVDSPGTGAVLLTWRRGRLLRLHCLVPVAVILASGLVAIAIGAAGGLVDGKAVEVAALLAIPAVLVAVLGAALSAKRGGRIPQELLLATAGDTSGLSALVVVGWIFAWAVLAIVLVASAATMIGPEGAAAEGGATAQGGAGLIEALRSAAGLAVAVALLGTLLGREPKTR